MSSSERVIGGLVAILAAIANIATIIVLYRMYRFGETGIPFQGGQFDYLTGALVAVPVLILLNVMSARLRPAHWFFRWVIDFAPSALLLAASLTALGLSLFTHFRPPQSQAVLFLFGGLAIWGFADVFFNQMKNLNDLMDRMHGTASAGAGRSTQPPSDMHNPPMTVYQPRRVIMRDEYFYEHADGTLEPMDSPHPLLTQTIDYHWVEDPPQIAAPAPADNSTQPPTAH